MIFFFSIAKAFSIKISRDETSCGENGCSIAACDDKGIAYPLINICVCIYMYI